MVAGLERDTLGLGRISHRLYSFLLLSLLPAPSSSTLQPERTFQNTALATLQTLPGLPKRGTSPGAIPLQPLPAQAFLLESLFAKAVPLAGNALPAFST